MLLVPNNKTPLPTPDRTWELNLHQRKPTTLIVVNVDAYKTKWR
jgi:hypothetical protein